MLNILDEYLGNKSYEGSETILKNKQDQWKRRISSPYQGITYFFIGSNTTKYKHMYYQVVYSFIFFNPFLMIHFIFGQLLRKILTAGRTINNEHSDPIVYEQYTNHNQ